MEIQCCLGCEIPEADAFDQDFSPLMDALLRAEEANSHFHDSGVTADLFAGSIELSLTVRCASLVDGARMAVDVVGHIAAEAGLRPVTFTTRHASVLAS